MNEQQREALEALEDVAENMDPEAKGAAFAVACSYILNSTTIPEGWQLVPVEPTKTMMLTAMYCMPPNTHPVVYREIYGSMLAAAPAPEDSSHE